LEIEGGLCLLMIWRKGFLPGGSELHGRKYDLEGLLGRGPHTLERNGLMT